MLLLQSITLVLINRSFLGVFFGTAVISLSAAGRAFAGLGRPAAPFLLAGALFYLVGVFFVTMLGNVPLNDQLAAKGSATGRSTGFQNPPQDRSSDTNGWAASSATTIEKPLDGSFEYWNRTA